MTRYRWVLILVGALLVGVLFVALNQVREAHGQKHLIRFIPAVADVDPEEIKLPEERERKTRTAPQQEAAPAAPASVATPEPAPVAPEGCPPPPACDPVAPCEITLPLEPEAYEPPPPPPKEWPLLGSQITDALLHALAAEDQSFLGYRPNDLIIGRVIDNRTNFQRGLYAAARAEIDLLLNLVEPPPPAAVGRVRQALVEGNLEKWWFPAAEKTAGEGLVGLREFSGGLASGAIRIPASPDNLSSLLRINNDLLASVQAEVTTGRVGFFESDDHFYQAQGAAAAVLATLDAAALSFKTALADSGADKDLNEARDWLGKAARMSPVMVTGGAGSDGGQLMVIAYYLERAEDALRGATDRLSPAGLEGK